MKFKSIILIFFLLGNLALRAQIKEANQYFRKSNYALAIPLYEKAALSNDDSTKKQAVFQLADCYRLTNNPKKAAKWYQRMLPYNDADPVGYYHLGMAFRMQGNNFESERAFKKFEEKVPLEKRAEIYARYNYNVGTQYEKRSSKLKQANHLFECLKYSKAIPFYKSAYFDGDVLDKKEATIRLADCYRFINDASSASSWYEKSVLYTDADPINYYYLGMAYRSLANYSAAERAFMKYEEKVPTDSRAKYYIKYNHDIQEWVGLPPSAEIKNAETLNSVYSEFSPYFYEDKLIFSSDRDIDLENNNNYLWTNFGYLDLYMSQPSSNNDFRNNLTKPIKLSKTFNQPYHDGPASFTSDFKEIFTTRTIKNSVPDDSTKYKTDYMKIYYADLSNEANITYKEFPYNNDNYSVGHPAISADGSKLIFVSEAPGGFGQSDLYVTERKDGHWSEPVNLGPEINTFGKEAFPFFANDSTLFFASDGLLGLGGLDIYQTSLVNGKWTTPLNLKQPINSPQDDFGIVFDKTLTKGFFSSNRDGGKGSDDIYSFWNYRLVPDPQPMPEEKILTMVSGYVKDERTMAPLDSASIFLLNTTTSEVLVLKTNKDGYFQTSIDKGVQYIAKAMKPNYFNDCLNFNFPVEETAVNLNTPRDLLLSKYELNQVFTIDNIYYDLDKWSIRNDAKPELDKLVDILKEYPINVELDSYTDARASTKYNDSLSQKRAKAAVEYLIANGIDASRLTYKGYGERVLVNKCGDGILCDEAEHQANRRTEFKITAVNIAMSNADELNLIQSKAGDKIQFKVLNVNFFDDVTRR